MHVTDPTINITYIIIIIIYNKTYPEGTSYVSQFSITITEASLAYIKQQKEKKKSKYIQW